MFAQESLDEGAERLENGKLKRADINRLVSIFRTYLRSSIQTYCPNLAGDLDKLDDNDGSGNVYATEYATGLLVLIDSDFGVEAFTATNQSANSFNYSERDYRFEVFKYMMGLLYDVPDGLTAADVSVRLPGSGTRYSSGGSYYRVK